MSLASLLPLAWWSSVRALTRLFARAPEIPLLESGGTEETSQITRDALRELRTSVARCHGCGACDSAFDAYAKVDRAVLRAPSDLVPLARVGSVPALTRFSRALSRGDLRALDRACPVGISFSRFVTLFPSGPEPTAAIRPKRATTAVRHDPG